MKTTPRRFLVERLEDRTVPATWGVAWPGADHLKVSFAPDGTGVSGAPSALFQTLNAVATPSVWQTEILRALQTWAVNANINLGLVSDGGQALGGPGLTQGDPRFGDVRITARPMGADVVALASPFDVSLDTGAGDVLFNSSAGLGVGPGAQYDLFSVALHESAHVFGLGDNNDPNSVLDWYYQGVRTGLSPADVGLLQGLYGPRTPDGYEGMMGNNGLATATSISVPEVAADITTASDGDFFRYTVPADAEGTVTVTVRTAGLSLLTPRLTVYDALGQVVGTAQSTDPLHNDVTVTLQNVQPGDVLTVGVQAARADVFGIGGYRLQINSGAVSAAQIQAIDASLDGTASPVVVNQDANDAPATATDLGAQGSASWVTSGLSTASGLDYYKVVAPTTAMGQTMVVAVNQTGASTLDPQLTVYDAQGNVVAAQVLVNDQSSYAVQVVGATPGATYFLRVSANALATDPAAATGEYVLGVTFQAASVTPDAHHQNTATDAGRVSAVTFRANASRMVELSLSAAGVGGSVLTAVRMNVYDAAGNLVASLTARAGETVSESLFLQQGTYAVRFVAATQDGSALPDLAYQMNARVLNDPQDPPPVDPTLDPTSSPPPPPPPVVVSTDPPPALPPLDPASDPWTPI